MTAAEPPASSPSRSKPRSPWPWVFPIGLLACAYSLLGLTFTENPAHSDLMMRCVLMNLPAARVWSVANVEVGLAYFGVFFGMLYHVVVASKADRTHLRDLGYAFIYLSASFSLNYVCVANFQPFEALVIGDVIILTFTAVVSQRIWFQRLLGVFVPLVFFTCGMGHLLEGLSFWVQTYRLNVPWAMVTADIGFAVLLNAARFPAFIRGQSLLAEVEEIKAEASARLSLVRDVLLGATQGRLRVCGGTAELPARLPECDLPVPLSQDALTSVRSLTARVAQEAGYSADRIDQIRTAVTEASMNAVVHANGGTITVCGDESQLQIWIEDHGSGIQVTQLPRATLERGYSTKGSLGHGFWLMLNMTDEVHLYTSGTGTTIVLVFYQSATQALDMAHGQTILGIEPA